MSYLKNAMDSVLEEDDFMEFSKLIDPVIEFHRYDAYLLYWKSSITSIFLKNYWLNYSATIFFMVSPKP